MGFLNSFILSVTIINQILLHLLPDVAATTDVLRHGDELNSLDPTSSLVSVNGSFTMGFFGLRDSGYLGIWYTDDPDRKVWVANRHRPMFSNGALMIDYESGTLNVNIRGEPMITLFSVPNQVDSGNNARLVLEDSGSLVLYADGTRNRTLWQSFDHPTDTLLPGMKLGYNLTTGQNWTLTSWLADSYPAPGTFTLRLEQIQNSTQLVIYRRGGKAYWSSSGWTSIGFEFVHGFNQTLVSDSSGMYFSIQADVSMMPILQLSSMGVLNDGGRDLTPSLCYGYQNQDGCAISSLPTCRGERDRFQLESGTTLSSLVKQAPYSYSYSCSQFARGFTYDEIIQQDYSSNVSVSDCMERCWNDCNCKGFSTSDDETGCITLGGDAQFVFIQKYLKKIGVLFSQKPLKRTTAVLRQGDELNATSNLVSTSGSFTLRFDTSQNSTYLGIWYNGIHVWDANHNRPMTGNGSLMIYQESRTLNVIIRGENGGTNITLFNVSSQGNSSNNARLLLEDSGNLVLYSNPTRNHILWQSFDHPTDTLLPGMKLGYNLTTGQNWTLTSYLGSFTLGLELVQNFPQLVIRRRGKVYWSSGLWVDKISGFKYLNSSNFGTGTLVSDTSGMYFAIQKGRYIIENTMLQLFDMPGRLVDGENNLVTPTFCYGYESHDGCGTYSSLPNCRDQSDSFVLHYGNWVGYFIQYYNNSNIIQSDCSDCMERCWNDCNCIGFSSNGTGCTTWGKNALFSRDDTGGELSGIFLSPRKINKHKEKVWLWILVSVAILLTCALTTYLLYHNRLRIRRFVIEITYLCFMRIRWCVIEATYWCYVRIGRCMLEEKQKRRRDDYIHQLTGSASFNYGDEVEMSITDAPDVKIFSLKAILTATDNFSNENKLGQGGYGPVYKGNLFDGREIAVKRLSKTSGQGIEEFKNELILISKLQHTNLVRLYGCCIHQQEKMLIYELMPNKSLDFFLFGTEDKKETINWQMRINIIEGVAQGLLYLHKYSRMRVIHRDLKVSNVLLDINMNPKIADFGMARIFQQNVTEAITNRVVGTYGYMAPEYAMRGTFSIKSDVFSFGVLVLEIVSGKRNTSFYSHDRTLNLLGYAWELWKGETSIELKDKSLDESCDLKQLLRTIHVGLLCVQENPDDRPTMTEVVSMLNNEIADLHNPNQPAFLFSTSLVEAEGNLSDFPCSDNGLTISVMEAR